MCAQKKKSAKISPEKVENISPEHSRENLNQ